MKSIKSTITRITHNRDARTLAGNFVWLSLLQVASYLFPLITMPYLAKVIGAEGFGKIAFASAIMVWMQTIADWGFNLTATRDIAKNRENSELVAKIFSNVLWSRCLLAIFSFVVLLALICVIPKFNENRLVIMVTFLMIPGHIFFPDWFFQAVEKMKYITILNILLRLLFTISVFLFVKEKEDYILQPLITSIGYLVCGAISLYIIVVKWGVKIYKPSSIGIFTTIKNSTDVFINNLAPNLYNSMSIVLLGVFGGSAATGIFDGGNKFISMSYQVLSIIEQTFFPFLSRYISGHNIFLLVNLLASSIMAIVLFCGAPLIINLLLSPEFADSVVVLKIMSLSVIFRAISNVYGKNFLIIMHRERELRSITVRCSIVGFIIAMPLIYHYGYIGAALTMTIGIFLMALFTAMVAKKTNNGENC